MLFRKIKIRRNMQDRYIKIITKLGFPKNAKLLDKENASQIESSIFNSTAKIPEKSLAPKENPKEADISENPDKTIIGSDNGASIIFTNTEAKE